MSPTKLRQTKTKSTKETISTYNPTNREEIFLLSKKNRIGICTYSYLIYCLEMPKVKSGKHNIRGGYHQQQQDDDDMNGSGDNNHTNSRNNNNSNGNKGKSVRTLLAPNTSIGQHFLKNPAVVDAIVSKSFIKSSDIVLEVGPGTGNLTVRLLEAAKKVVAVEFDKRMVREVLKRVETMEQHNNLQVIHGDVLKVALPYFDVCVANLPYQISSPFLFKMLSHRPMFKCAVIMFQLEFAQRLTALPGSELYCRLSVNTQLLAKVENLLKVGRNNFRPPPKVDSMVVKITLKNPPPPINFIEWDGLVRLLFNRKNKTVRSIMTQKSCLAVLEENLKTHMALNNEVMPSDSPSVKEIVEEVLIREQYGDKRASKMDLNDFLCLLAAFNEKGIHFS